jgi:hypothetical protein
MAFAVNRIDGTPALPALRPENVSIRGDQAIIELRLFPDQDVELYFPAQAEAFEPVWLELAADVLSHLTAMDNQVQRVSAEQWARSPYPSSYYEGELVYITLARLDEAVLHYNVLGCNAEWDERFVRSGGQWSRAELAAAVARPGDTRL